MNDIRGKSFAMTNPIHILPGIYTFHLDCADEALYDFVADMPCVTEVERAGFYAKRVQINTLYDYEEAWLWIYEQLEIESKRIQLDKRWDALLSDDLGAQSL